MMAKEDRIAAYDYETGLATNIDPEEVRPSRTRRCVRGCLAFMLSHIGLTALVVGYTVGGALLFMYLEEGKWLADQNADLDRKIPEWDGEPDYIKNATGMLAFKQWKASWMEDKVLRFWNFTHQVNEIYPNDWTQENYENIRLWEIELNEQIIRTVVQLAKEYATNNVTRALKQENNNLNAPDWEFPSAFLYALSIVTTIGYGHVFPHTPNGKIVTIFYAILGIPIVLAFLANIGELMAKALRAFFDHVCLLKCCRTLYSRRRARLASMAAHSGPPSTAGGSSPAPIRVQKQSVVVQDGSSVGVRSLKAYGYSADELYPIMDGEKREESVPVLMCVIIMGLYLLGGALLFTLWEGWTFLQGFYFCFITLSTIGFGDLIPGSTLKKVKGESHLQPIVCCMYIMFGLALLASCFNLLHDSARKSIRTVGKKIGLVKRKPKSRRPSRDML